MNARSCTSWLRVAVQTLSWVHDLEKALSTKNEQLTNGEEGGKETWRDAIQGESSEILFPDWDRRASCFWTGAADLLTCNQKSEIQAIFYVWDDDTVFES